jgi:hypothetical protein
MSATKCRDCGALCYMGYVRGHDGLALVERSTDAHLVRDLASAVMRFENVSGYRFHVCPPRKPEPEPKVSKQVPEAFVLELDLLDVPRQYAAQAWAAHLYYIAWEDDEYRHNPDGSDADD